MRGVDLSVCRCCAGVWLDPESLGLVLRAMHEEPLKAVRHETEGASTPVDTGPAIACPVCGRALRRLTMPVSGVEVDRCDAHGTWFDRHELERAASAARAGAARGAAAVGAAATIAAAASVGLGAAGGAGPRNQETSTLHSAGEVAGEVVEEGVWLGAEVAAEGGVEAMVEVAAGTAEVASGLATGAGTEAAGAALETVFGMVGDILGGLLS